MQEESTVFLYADYFAGSFIRVIRVGKISVKSALNKPKRRLIHKYSIDENYLC